MKSQKRLVPYEMVAPGFEAVYTGERTSKEIEPHEIARFPPYGQTIRLVDDRGNIYEQWTTWTWLVEPREKHGWAEEEVNYINTLQAKLGHLDDKTRQIRAHIGSLVPCDSGFPVTVDELLQAIGSGELRTPSFHNGCSCAGRWWDPRGTQPLQAESLATIGAVLRGYLAGETREDMVQKHPAAQGFIGRACEWLGPVTGLTAVQKLMVERMLFLLEICSQTPKDPEAAEKLFFAGDSRGKQVDAAISSLAGLPEIYADYRPEYWQNVETISDPEKLEQYRLCCALAHGLHGTSDCHHSTFRWLEKWIYAIGTGKFDIPTRKKGSERERLGHLLFGYALGLDRWLSGAPMQFVLLDLGHINLGFDPKNEIVRVYACLGEEKSPLKEWLAASLWHNLVYNHPTGLVIRHKDLLDYANQAGVSVQGWMDPVLEQEPL